MDRMLYNQFFGFFFIQLLTLVLRNALGIILCALILRIQAEVLLRILSI